MSNTKGRSNAANGTKQIWVKNTLHRALSSRAGKKGQAIREVVERMLLSQLGYDVEDDDVDTNACLQHLKEQLDAEDNADTPKVKMKRQVA